MLSLGVLKSKWREFSRPNGETRLHFLPDGKKIDVQLRQAIAGGAHPRRIYFSSLPSMQKAGMANAIPAFWSKWRDSFAFSSRWEENGCSAPSSRRRRRSSAPHLFFESRPSDAKNRNGKGHSGFLSKWRDSNSRHPGPKELLELFSNIFRSFWRLLFQKTCSLKLLSPLFPYTPKLNMVNNVVKSNDSPVHI